MSIMFEPVTKCFTADLENLAIFEKKRIMSPMKTVLSPLLDPRLMLHLKHIFVSCIT